MTVISRIFNSIIGGRQENFLELTDFFQEGG
jgi:hypothetical protein